MKVFYLLLLLLKTINSKSYLVELAAHKVSDESSNLQKLEADLDKRAAQNDSEKTGGERTSKDYLSIQEARDLGCEGTILQATMCTLFSIFFRATEQAQAYPKI